MSPDSVNASAKAADVALDALALGGLQPAPAEQMHVFKSGAKRSGKKPRYDLISPVFLKGIAEVLTSGAEKYGEHNWKRGDKEMANDCINHLIEHLYKFKAGDRSEPHLFNAGCNLMFMAHFCELHPEWFAPSDPFEKAA
jgi:hypothetical protein